jgi:CheY-like chemotaxis protein
MSAHAGNKTILIVDDDDDIRDTMAELLESEGYNVALAADGRQALDHLRRAPAPCLILLDLMMPVMNGFQFREEQRRDPRLAGIPVVVITAGQASKALSLAVDTILTKPLGVSQLLATVAQHC